MNKSIIISILFAGIFSAFANLSFASDRGGKEKAVIMTSAKCGECQERIEGAVKKLDGIKTVDLNLDNKKVTVVFDPALTSLDKIKTAISEAGYDADDVKANAAAYQALPACCQKGGH